MPEYIRLRDLYSKLYAEMPVGTLVVYVPIGDNFDALASMDAALIGGYSWTFHSDEIDPEIAFSSYGIIPVSDGRIAGRIANRTSDQHGAQHGIILTSSGTTSARKRFHLQYDGWMMTTREAQGIKSQDSDSIFLNFLNPGWISGLSTLYHSLTVGSMIYDANFDPFRLVETINTVRPNHMVMLPSHYRMITRSSSRLDLSSLRMISTGGSVPDREFVDSMFDAGMQAWMHGYSQTEAPFPVLYQVHRQKTEDYRWLQSGSSYRFAVSDDGELLLSGIPVHSHRIEIDGSITRTGEWHATGDLFERDGRYRFIGRKDDIIKWLDKRVSLIDIDSALADTFPDADFCSYVDGESFGIVYSRGSVIRMNQLKSIQLFREFSLRPTDLRRVEAIFRNANGKIVRTENQKLNSLALTCSKNGETL